MAPRTPRSSASELVPHKYIAKVNRGPEPRQQLHPVVHGTIHIFRGSNYDGSSVGSGLCVLNCTNQREGGGYAFHPGSVTFLLADGSVRGVSENTDTGVVGRIISFAGGNPTGEF